MNNSCNLFEELLAINTLVTMQGVIPSLSEFQQSLKQRIMSFCHSLQIAGYDSKEVDALQRLICFVTDKQIAHCMESQGISWYGYELEKVFYHYDQDPILGLNHTRILLNSKNKEIRRYALHFISQSSVKIPGNDKDISRPDVAPVTASIPKRISKKIEADDSLEENSELSPSSHPFRSQLKNVWMPLFIQLFIASLFLMTIWFGCSQFLADRL